MLFENPIFGGWYTDSVDVYRVVQVKNGNLTKQERKKINTAPIPCRVYNSQKNGPSMSDTASKVVSTEKLACDLSADIKTGDELMVVRGGSIGRENTPVRYIAGNPQEYYDPVDGVLSGLEHKEVGLMMENIVG